MAPRDEEDQDLTFESDDERKLREEREDRAELVQLHDDGDLKAVMTEPSGRRFLYRVLSQFSGAWNGSFAGERPLTSAFNEGKRDVGLQLIEQVQRVAPEAWLLMLQEQADVLAREKRLEASKSEREKMRRASRASARER